MLEVKLTILLFIMVIILGLYVTMCLSLFTFTRNWGIYKNRLSIYCAGTIFITVGLTYLVMS